MEMEEQTIRYEEENSSEIKEDCLSVQNISDL